MGGDIIGQLLVITATTTLTCHVKESISLGRSTEPVARTTFVPAGIILVDVVDDEGAVRQHVDAAYGLRQLRNVVDVNAVQ